MSVLVKRQEDTNGKRRKKKDFVNCMIEEEEDVQGSPPNCS